MTPDQLFTRFAAPLIHTTSTGNAYGATAQVYDSVLTIVEPLSVLLTIFFVASTIYFIVKTNWYAIRRARIRDVVLKSNYPKRRAVKIWREIEHHAAAGDEKDLKLAVIEADKVLDELLKMSGFKGLDLGERLKNVNQGQLSVINEVWEAHKLRNRLVHEIDHPLSRDTAERALAIYEQAFKELGLIE